VLRKMVTDDPAKNGISQAFYDGITGRLLTPVNVKKIDIGGGLIHGRAEDFSGDASGKVFLSHTSAPLTDAQTETVRALAIRAFEACRIEAMARIDFFLRDDGTFVVNELNTIPGFTPISMYPRLWEVTGVPYAALLDRLIDLARARGERRARRRGRQR